MKHSGGEIANVDNEKEKGHFQEFMSENVVAYLLLDQKDQEWIVSPLSLVFISPESDDTKLLSDNQYSNRVCNRFKW